MTENYYGLCLSSRSVANITLSQKNPACNRIPYEETTLTASINRMIELCPIFNSYLM